MPYKEHGMWEVHDVLKRIRRGESVRSISKSTGRDRKTVTRYRDAAQELGWDPRVHEPSEALASEVIARLRPGPQGDAPSAAESLLAQSHDVISGWLAADNPLKKGLRLTKVQTLLGRNGVHVSYSALRRYAVKHFDFGREQATVRVADTEPGEVAEVDFGRLGHLRDPETGKNKTLHALVVTLVFSRHQYVHLTHGQKLDDLIEGLEDAFEFFGGATKRVIIDNLKPAVYKADRYDPTFQRTFDEYAAHRGFVIDAAVAREPTHKPHVERQVPYVRESFFRGEHFASKEHAQEEAIRWCLKMAGMRVHGTTRKRPLVEFEDQEKQALSTITKERFDTPKWGTPKVHPDCHVRFDYALYSVPYKYRGKKTTVRGDSKLVRIYIGGALVKTHPKKAPGGRSTDWDDYPKDKSPYAMRDANYIIRQAKSKGEHIGRFAEELLSGEFPWSNLRQSQKLLRLADKYSVKVVEAACKRALHFDLVNVKRLERIVKNGMERSDEIQSPSMHSDGSSNIIQLPLRFLRDAGSFKHNQTKENN